MVLVHHYSRKSAINEKKECTTPTYGVVRGSLRTLTGLPRGQTLGGVWGHPHGVGRGTAAWGELPMNEGKNDLK